jgi:hypothetical protein
MCQHYNTIFHRSIQAMPFSLTYGIEARLPSFFTPDFCRLHDPHLAEDNLLRTLHQARDIAVSANLLATDKQRNYFEKTATHHEFHEGQFVLLNEFNFLNKNKKLASTYSGPFKIIQSKGRTMWSCCSLMVAKLLSMSQGLNTTLAPPLFLMTRSHQSCQILMCLLITICLMEKTF